MIAPGSNGAPDGTSEELDEPVPPYEPTGPVAFMARNRVAANLLMIFLVVSGLFSIRGIVQEVFPEFSLDQISISVLYPGATPEEVEESIIRKIEEQVESVEGVKEITATAAEGLGQVLVELKLGTDLSQALDDVKAEVDQITTFPVDAERPEVRELTNRQSVMRLAIFGDATERTVKEVAYQVEDALSALPEVSYVQTGGIRQYEISIEIPEERLRALGLTLSDVAARVRAGSLDLSAGSIETRDEQVRVRTLGQNYTQQEFEDIVIVSRPDGTVVRLGEIAEVRDGFEDTDLITRYNGQRAALVEVFRTSDEKVLEIVEAVETHLDAEIRPTIPAGVSLDVWSNEAVVLQDRLALLIRNALIGLGLVLLALTLFLELRLAFWVAVGIGISFIGTLTVMLLVGISINVLSLFGFILAVGIVVDDAIMVGENIYAERERGTPPAEAAVRGARRITGPVIFAVLTTVVAFTPLLAVPGTIGKILAAIPLIVIAVLILSLVESLLILPHHLSHLPPPHHSASSRIGRWIEGVQNRVDAGLRAFVEGPLDRGLRFATEAPGIVVAAAVALIIIAASMVPAGILRVEFFPQVEGDNVVASLEMPEGTPASRTLEVTNRIREAGERVAARLEEERPDDAPPLVEGIYQVVGQPPQDGGPGGSGPSSQPQGNISNVDIKLLAAEERDLSSQRFERLWREEVGPLPEVRSLSFNSSLIGFGEAVAVELSHPDPVRLRSIGDQLMEELSRFEGVYDIQADQDQGLREIQLRLKPAARTLGLTLDDLARQVRAAFFGEEALRIQRGREDVRVYVRLPERQRDAIDDVERYRIRTPDGGEVPLRQVADVSFGTSPTTIQRKDGQRVLTVTAEVDPGVVTGQEVNAQLEAEVLPVLRSEAPRLRTAFGGEQEEQAESFGSLGSNFLLALLVIYALLAIPFGSYVQPLIIMAAIPFGIIGAVIGHLLLDLPVGLLSLFGIIGLSGVVVNDSLVMIDFINEERARGRPAREAIVYGAKKRFRPILLTSVTTFLGVSPLVFEKSLQAQFLIPMAASLGFGILFATGILMLLVPALATLEHQFEQWMGIRRAGAAMPGAAHGPPVPEEETPELVEAGAD
jgi:multidrug efflux pump subunit AcrB